MYTNSRHVSGGIYFYRGSSLLHTRKNVHGSTHCERQKDTDRERQRRGRRRKKKKIERASTETTTIFLWWCDGLTSAKGNQRAREMRAGENLAELHVYIYSSYTTAVHEPEMREREKEKEKERFSLNFKIWE